MSKSGPGGPHPERSSALSPKVGMALALGLGLVVGGAGSFAAISSSGGWLEHEARAERAEGSALGATSPAPGSSGDAHRGESVVRRPGLESAIDDAVRSLGATPSVHDVSSLLRELERKAREEGAARAIHVEPGLAAIDAASPHIGYGEAERLRGRFLSTMQALATESRGDARASARP